MNGRDLGDVAAGIGAFGTVMGYLPEVSAVLAIIWTVIRIYEWARVRIFGMDDKETFK
ncbi:MAG: hypothetical protein ACT4OK_11055 [Gemmobacter sp.]